jgi:hypothetical protein
MTTLNAGQKLTISLNPLRALTVIGDALADVRVWRLGDRAGDAARGYTAVSASETKLIGPFAELNQFEVECVAGSVTFGDAAVDYPTSVEADASGQAAGDLRYQPILTNDVLELIGAGVPVDYTDGTPPATGEGLAGPGSRYTDITGAKLYLNTGTKAQPIWQQLAFVIV